MIINEKPGVSVHGHVLITDITDPANTYTVLDKDNAIHSENFSVAIADSLAGSVDSAGLRIGAVSTMAFGNGATTILSTGRVTYKTPRVSTYGGLYNQTYSKKINANLFPTVESDFNSVTTVHIPGQIFSDIVCVCTLGLSEPSDQTVSSSTDMDGKYVFDEIMLASGDADTGALTPLTHLIFHPVEKSANRVLQVKYTIRIQIQ